MHTVKEAEICYANYLNVGANQNSSLYVQSFVAFNWLHPFIYLHFTSCHTYKLIELICINIFKICFIFIFAN